jgi:hypothetical protein
LSLTLLNKFIEIFSKISKENGAKIEFTHYLHIKSYETPLEVSSKKYIKYQFNDLNKFR